MRLGRLQSEVECWGLNESWEASVAVLWLRMVCWKFRRVVSMGFRTRMSESESVLS